MPFAGQQLTPEQIRAYAQQAGFTGSALETVVRIAIAESSGYTQATNYNPTTGCIAGRGSTDHGVMQINDTCWPQYTSNGCADDPLCALKAAFVISKGGSDFTPWSTFNAGLAGGGGGGGGGNPAGTTGVTLFGPGDIPFIGEGITGIKNAIGGVLGGIASGAVKDTAALLFGLLKGLVDPLKRVGIFTAGLALLVVGGIIIAGKDTVVQLVTKEPEAPAAKGATP